MCFDHFCRRSSISCSPLSSSPSGVSPSLTASMPALAPLGCAFLPTSASLASPMIRYASYTPLGPAASSFATSLLAALSLSAPASSIWVRTSPAVPTTRSRSSSSSASRLAVGVGSPNAACIASSCISPALVTPRNSGGTSLVLNHLCAGSVSLTSSSSSLHRWPSRSSRCSSVSPCFLFGLSRSVSAAADIAPCRVSRRSLPSGMGLAPSSSPSSKLLPSALVTAAQHASVEYASLAVSVRPFGTVSLCSASPSCSPPPALVFSRRDTRSALWALCPPEALAVRKPSAPAATLRAKRLSHARGASQWSISVASASPPPPRVPTYVSECPPPVVTPPSVSSCSNDVSLLVGKRPCHRSASGVSAFRSPATATRPLSAIVRTRSRAQKSCRRAR